MKTISFTQSILKQESSVWKEQFNFFEHEEEKATLYHRHFFCQKTISHPLPQCMSATANRYVLKMWLVCAIYRPPTFTDSSFKRHWFNIFDWWDLMTSQQAIIETVANSSIHIETVLFLSVLKHRETPMVSALADAGLHGCAHSRTQ